MPKAPQFRPRGIGDVLKIQLGGVPGMRVFGAMGERETIQTGAAGEDLWRGNELSPAPTSHLLIPTPATAGEQMTVVSESTADAPAGAGADEVTIEYIDAAGAEQTETVALNGTTGVDTTATDIRFVNDFYVSALGAANTTGVATGPIKIYKKGTVGLVYSMIAAGGNMSLVPHRMVPADHQLCLQGWHVSEKSNAKRCLVRLRADCTNGATPTRQAGVFLFKSTAFLDQTAVPIGCYNTIPALSIVKASAWAAVAGAEAACSWWGILSRV